MSGNQQALLMAGGGSSTPPVLRCVGDPYYDPVTGDPFWSNVILLLRGNGAAGGTIFTDSSEDNLTASVGSPGITTQPDTASFSGSAIQTTLGSAWISFTFPDPIQTSEPFTIEGFVQVVSRSPATAGYADGTMSILRFLSGGPTGTKIVEVSGAGNSSVQVTFSAPAAQTVTLASFTNRFHFAAVRPAGSSVISVYINGVFLYNGSSTSGIDCLRIGASPLDVTRRASAFVDEVRVTKGVARYGTNFTVPTQEYPGFFQAPGFTTLSLHGDAVADSSAQTKTLNNLGVTTSTAESRFGGNSLFFNGSTNYITATPLAGFFLGSLPFTVEAWVYPTFYGTVDRPIFNLCEANIVSFAYIGFSILGGANAGRLQAVVRPATGGSFVLLLSNPGDVVPLNQWTNIAFSFSGANAYVFINGVLVGTSASWVAYPDAKVLFVGIGSFGNNFTAATLGRFQGYLDDLRVTVGAARYTATYTPLPTVTFCESTSDQFTGQVNGTDFPRGQEVVSSQGTIRVLNPWVRLQGQQLLSTQGSLTGALPNRTFALTGQQIQAQTGVASPPGKTVALSGARVDVRAGALRVPPYPDLVSSEVSAGPQAFPGTDVPAATAAFSTDGTYTVTYAGGSVRTGNWIDVAGSAYNIADIATQYSIRTVLTAFPSLVTSSAPLPAALGTTISFFVVPGIGSFTVGVLVVPKINNPRYGELGYVSQTDIEFRIE